MGWFFPAMLDPWPGSRAPIKTEAFWFNGLGPMMRHVLAMPFEAANWQTRSKVPTRKRSNSPLVLLLRLFDSAEFGDDLRSDSESVRLLPGAYRVRAAYFKTSSLMIVVREIART